MPCRSPEQNQPNLFGDDQITAEFSTCRTWRYILRRRWAPGPALGFIMLNPSTADEAKNDPTIRRCIGFAKTLGAGALIVGNIFAFRATFPRDLKQAADPIGPDNDAALMRIAHEAHAGLICAWGAHGAFMNRGAYVLALLKTAQARPLALGLTAAGDPKHPLYLAASQRPFPLQCEKPPTIHS